MTKTVHAKLEDTKKTGCKEIKPQFVEKNIHCSLSSSLILYMEEQIKFVSKNIAKSPETIGKCLLF